MAQLVRSHWIAHLFTIPKNLPILGPQADLEGFLFGRDRACLADAACNGDKRDTLAARPHLERWLARNASHGGTLASVLEERLVCDLPTATQVARWSYEADHAARARLWAGRGAYAPIDARVLDAFR